MRAYLYELSHIHDAESPKQVTVASQEFWQKELANFDLDHKWDPWSLGDEAKMRTMTIRDCKVV